MTLLWLFLCLVIRVISFLSASNIIVLFPLKISNLSLLNLSWKGKGFCPCLDKRLMANRVSQSALD